MDLHSLQTDEDVLNDTSENEALANEDESVANSVESIDTAHNDVDDGQAHPEIPIENLNDISSELAPTQVKKEPKMNFLNLPDDILEISGDEFDVLREELAYGNDCDDSFDELRKELQNSMTKNLLASCLLRSFFIHEEYVSMFFIYQIIKCN